MVISYIQCVGLLLFDKIILLINKQKQMGNQLCEQSNSNLSAISSITPDPNPKNKFLNEHIESPCLEDTLFEEDPTPLKNFINLHQNQKPICASNNLYFTSTKKLTMGGRHKEEMRRVRSKSKRQASQSHRCSIENNPFGVVQLTLKDFVATDEHLSQNFGRIEINQEKFIQLRKQDVKKYYKFEEIIGEGSFGSVYRALSLRNKQERAIKIIKKQSLAQNKKEEIFAELQLLKKLDHPNIIKLYQVFENKQRYHVVTEYCRGGSIIDFIKERKHFDENIVKIILKQLLGCLNYLHTLRIVHRDIKLENVVFINKIKQESAADDSEIKLLDFGTSCKMNKHKVRCSELIGTMSYMAPEIIEGYFTDKCDLWSCGVILFILLTSKSPFKCKKKEDTIQKILNYQPDFEESIWNDISFNAKDLVMKLLDKDPAQRFSANQALQHAWFQSSKEKVIAKNSDFLNNLSNYYRENNLISVLESYLVFSKVSQDERKRISLLFKQLDRNHDGIIQKNELIQAYKEANSGQPDLDEIEYVLNKIDKDKTGSISLNEFSSVMINRQKLFAKQALQSAFDYFANGTGYIEINSLSKLLLGSDSKQIENLLSELDEDSDRRISKEQFLHYLLRKGCLY